jgi:hypothetical protein
MLTLEPILVARVMVALPIEPYKRSEVPRGLAHFGTTAITILTQFGPILALFALISLQMPINRLSIASRMKS